MSGGSSRSNLEPLEILFSVGAAGSLTDGQLLDRFIQGPDDAARAAFLALVERHGPIVQRVCRQVLGDPHDAEDAAQATFLILARRSKSIRRRESVVSWIFGVAVRVSRCARVEAARRRHHERRRAAMTSPHSLPRPDITDPTSDEARTALLEELDRLPERLKAPIVACHLEGLTQEQAAARLRCSLRTLQRWLAIGRERLRLRLTRRGFGPAFVAAFAGLADWTRAAGLSNGPIPWANATVAAAMAVAASGTFAGAGATPGAVRLARITMRSITLMTAMKLAASALLFAGLAVVGLSTLANVADNPIPPDSTAADEPPDKPAASELTLSVVDAQTGKPIDGLPLDIVFERAKARNPSNLKKVTGARGRVSISIPKSESGHVTIEVHKEGYVPVELRWTIGPGRPLPSSYTLRLDRGTAIGGRVVDPQGKPVAGATVFVWVPMEDRRDRLPVVVDLFNVPYTTDVEGRWSCDVVPPDLETVWLRVEHPSHVRLQLIVSEAERAPSPVTIEGLRKQSTELALKPGLVVTGRVLDKATGKPISGAILRLGTNLFGGNDPETKTDGEGRFAINSAAAGPNTLTVQAAGHAPDTTPITVGRDLQPLTFRLGPGHAIRGRVVGRDAKPIPGAYVSVREWRGKEILLLKTQADAEGRFVLEDAPADEVEVQLAAEGSMIRPGVVMSPSADPRDYALSRPLRVAGTVTDAATGKPIETFSVIPTSTAARPPSSFERDDAKTFRDGRYAMEFNWPVPSERVFWFEAEGYRPATSRPIRHDDGSATVDISLERGAVPLREAVSGVVHLPDGSPAPGGISVYLATPSRGLYVNDGKPIHPHRVLATITRRDGAFRFPRQTESGVVVVLDDRGFAQKSEAEVAKSPTITLAPWGRVEGVVKSNGEPVPFAKVNVSIGQSPESEAGFPDYHCGASSDAQGHFVIDHVPPGKASIARGISTTPNSVSFGLWQAIRIEPGKTLSVTVGGAGRAVVGRLAIPSDLALGLKELPARLDLRPPPEPEIPEGLAIDERRAWFQRWSETEAGRAYVAWQNNRRHYPVHIDADRRFRCDDVLPGTYTLVIPLTDAESREPAPGTQFPPIEVPATQDGAAHTTLDIGEIGPIKTKPKGD